MNKETRQIIDRLMNHHDGLKQDYSYADVDPVNFQATDINVLYFIVCMEPKSPAFGTGIGAFVYKDTDVYQFHYHIHTPLLHGPRISNTMSNIEQVVLENVYDITMINYVETKFGMRAFWMHTPMDCLNDDEKSLRQLMKAVQSYCRRENLCGKLRKLDKAHEKWELDRQAKIKTGDCNTRDKLKFRLNTDIGLIDEQKTSCQ